MHDRSGGGGGRCMREREIYFKSHNSWWEHSRHFRLIGRGVPSVSVVSQLVYKFLNLAFPKENPQVRRGATEVSVQGKDPVPINTYMQEKGGRNHLAVQDLLVLGLWDVVDVAVGAGLQPLQQLRLDAGLQLRGRLRLGLPPPLALFCPASTKICRCQRTGVQGAELR